MRYAFLIVIALHTSAAMACETQSDTTAGDNSTTVMKRDCADQVAPLATPQKALPAIPSEGVKINSDANPPNPASANPVVATPQPKAVSTAKVQHRVRHNYKAVVKRLRTHHARKTEEKPMFWWHTRR